MASDKIKFTKKAITYLKADVLFSYTNSDFIPLHGGVLGRLFALDAGLVVECAHANPKPGTAMVLGPSKLPYKEVCHFAIAGIGNDPTEMSIRNAMRWGFQLMCDRQRATYVLPALNEDSGGMPCALAAEIVLREAMIFATNTFVEEISIQTKDKNEYSEYKAAYKRLVEK